MRMELIQELFSSPVDIPIDRNLFICCHSDDRRELSIILHVSNEKTNQNTFVGIITMQRFCSALIVIAFVCFIFTYLEWKDIWICSEKDVFSVNGVAHNVFQIEMPISDPWLLEQEKRKKNLHRACGRFANGFPRLSLLSLARRRRRLFHHVIVDDFHQTLYCYIPKIACTNWKKTLMILSGRTSAKDPRDKAIGNPHLPGSYTTLISYDLKNVAVRLDKYKKFLFVRHPFERLVSAYRNKFEVYIESSMNFKKMFGHKIVKGFKLGDPIPFPKFVDFILSGGNRPQEVFNEHWASYNDLCHPCLVSYDFIGRYETLMTDAEHILRHIKAPPSLKFPSHRSSNTSFLVSEYFKLLTENQIRGLQKLYYKDFMLFQYNQNLTSN